jgi:hypothetical protein
VEGQFANVGLTREFWADAEPVRRIFRKAFERAGLPYFNPHSLRNLLARLGTELCQNAEQLKAWSQNLGHEQLITTVYNYGSVAPNRQAQLMREVGRGR